MKSLANMAFALATSVAVVAVGMAAASLLTGSAEARNIPDQSVADLWTDTPRPVDVATQRLQREAPLYSTYAVEQQQRIAAAGRLKADDRQPRARTASISTSQMREAGPTEAAANWCADRYRSYDRATNTYLAYSGQVRTCLPPAGQASDRVAEYDKGPRL